MEYSAFTVKSDIAAITNSTDNPNAAEVDNSMNATIRSMFDPHGHIRITLYSIIFLLAIVGNTLVIITLLQNKRMRTVTNMFLLNLAVSDLMLALVCMPFTLIPTLMQNFVFGEPMCVLIRFLQAVSVGVSIFTLVVISLERYFAICSPLKSRQWQTIKHSYKSICLIWVAACICMIPTAATNKVIEMPNGGHKCLEIWGNEDWQIILSKGYTVFLSLILLVIPLCIMLVTYGFITRILWQGIKLETKSSSQEMSVLNNTNSSSHLKDDDSVDSSLNSRMLPDITASTSANKVQNSSSTDKMVRWNTEKSLAAKRRAIKMLFAVVLEFFICWTPTYVLMTWIAMDHKSAEKHIDSTVYNLIHLLAFCNTCCNPITYCFMNARFRQGFVSIFKTCLCRKRKQRRSLYVYNSSSVGHSGSPRTTDTSTRTAVDSVR